MVNTLYMVFILSKLKFFSISLKNMRKRNLSDEKEFKRQSLQRNIIFSRPVLVGLFKTSFEI